MDSEELELQGSVTPWLRGLKQADEDAAAVIWSRYFDNLVRLAQQALSNIHTADPEGVALSALKSFCLAAQRGRFEKLENREDLWRILITIARRKILNTRRDFQRLRRDQRQTTSLEGVDIPSEDPTPEILAGFLDEYQHLLDALSDDILIDIVRRRLAGETVSEIASLLGLSSRSIERKLSEIRRIWAARLKALQDA